MEATTPEELIQDVGEYLSIFLQFGKLDPLISKLDPELKINGLERLLRIHFVLKPEVISFIEDLPERVRRIKTQVDKNPERSKGTIKGKIDWNKTIKSRYSENPKDDTHYIFDKLEKSYHVNENLVLKDLLSHVHQIVFNDLKSGIDHHYPWIDDWIDGRELKNTVKTVYLDNVYMKRISPQFFSRDAKKVNDRVIANVTKSRLPLYKEAALLLRSFRKIMQFRLDPEEASSLLRETFIQPQKTEVLFQLSWIFRIIKNMTNEADNLKFNVIEDQGNHLAEWEDVHHIYRLYYDNAADFQFGEIIDNIPSPSDQGGYLAREHGILKGLRDFHDLHYQGTGTEINWCGTPEIILTKTNKSDNTLVKVFLGKVKYSNSMESEIQGLKELMECMVLIKENGNYLVDDPNSVSTSGLVEGWLFMDKRDHSRLDWGNISIVPYGEEILL